MSDLTLKRRQPAGREALKPIPEGTVRPKQYRWPSERHKLPTHCTYCGGRRLLSVVPMKDAPLIDLDCYLCSRTMCELVADGYEPRMTREQFAALPKQQGRRGQRTICTDQQCAHPGPDGGRCGSCNVRQWRRGKKAAK